MEDLVLTIEQCLANFGGHWKCFCNFDGENKSVFIYRTDDSGLIRVYVDGDYGFISDLFVKPRYRKQGIGGDLLFIADKIIGVMNLPFSQLRVKEGAWMKEWYLRKGFSEQSKEDGYIWMIKKLRNGRFSI